jgi:hypothetical protein
MEEAGNNSSPPEPVLEVVEPEAAMDEISDEQALEQAPPPPQLPTMTIPLAGMAARVIHQKGETALVVGPVLINFVIPFGAEGAKELAKELAGGIEIAHGGGDVAQAAAKAGIQLA